RTLRAVPTLRLLGLVLGLLAVTAITSPWIATALGAAGFDFKFSRVYNRVFEVLLVIAILLGWRRFDLGSATAIGLRHAGWARDLRWGLVIGALGVGAGVAAGMLGGAMVPRLRYDAATTSGPAAAGAVCGVSV